MKWLKTTALEHKALWRLKNGKKVFVKISASSFRNLNNSFRGGLGREQTCLEVLKGLAVPELVKLKKSEIPKIPGVKNALITATSFASTKDVHHIGLKPYELVAVWIFFVEQLVAFRRHQIVYTDFKCGNILGQRTPLKVTIIDFDHSFPLIKSRKKTLAGHGYTPGLASPEALRGELGTESSLVYECSLLLYHFLTDRYNQSLQDKKKGINHAVKLIDDMQASGISSLFQKCLQTDPLKRPQSYEEMLKLIDFEKLPPKMFKFYQRLRLPYEKRLAEVGL